MNKKILDVIIRIKDHLKWNPYKWVYDEKSDEYTKRRFDAGKLFNIVYLSILSIVVVVGFSFFKADYVNIMEQLNPLGIFAKFTLIAFWIFLYIYSIRATIFIRTGNFMFSLLLELAVILASPIIFKYAFFFLGIGFAITYVEDFVIPLAFKINNWTRKHEISKNKNNIPK